MEKPWWLKKTAPAEEAENAYDLDGVYYGDSNKKEEYGEAGNAYDGFASDDVSEVGVSLSYEPIKEVAKAEPILKKTFTPKDASDCQAVVDALKENRVVVLCVEELCKNRENFRRFFDYIMGAIQALDGELRKPDRDTAVLLPYAVAKDADESFNTGDYVDGLDEAADEGKAN
jgi:FtsZ-interacting cell division protein YlmF